jgi:LPS sulfotransferase NodH
MDTHDRLFFEFEREIEPRLSYLICSIPRSGSSFLCELLASTGIAGAPTEFFHPDKMARLKRRWGIDTMEEYLRALLARKTSPNGVFGAKAHWGQYEPAFGEADPRRLFPNVRVIFITRRDHLRQAVSWVRALQTLHWAATDRPRVERAAEFDPDHITRKLGRITREEGFWADLFERYGIAPHNVVYEDLIADRRRTLREVLEFIGVEPPVDLPVDPVRLERQADQLSEQWVERYLAETAQA